MQHSHVTIQTITDGHTVGTGEAMVQTQQCAQHLVFNRILSGCLQRADVAEEMAVSADPDAPASKPVTCLQLSTAGLFPTLWFRFRL